MKKIIILGSCGSIGTQTLDVLEKSGINYKIEAVSVGSNLELAIKIIKKYKPNLVCTKEEKHIDILQKEYKCTYVYGDNGLIEVACYKKDEKVLLVSALVGSVGLRPTVEAIKINRDIALANKETLVMAGEIVMDLVKKHNINLYPLDSEHSAIWQCMQGEDYKSVKKMIITASGGSLRDLSVDELDDVTKEQVLNHPNWSMGSKITVDSSTMMNKGFEVIEAHYLFDIDYDKIETILHKQSIVHSMVEFNDGQIKAQLGPHDMRLPIIYALNNKKRVDMKTNSLDFIKMKELTFEELSHIRFKCLKLAYDAGRKGNIFPAVLNAANDACVELFLQDKIKFNMIEKTIEEYLLKYKTIENITIEKIIEINKEVKKEIYQRYGADL